MVLPFLRLVFLVACNNVKFEWERQHLFSGEEFQEKKSNFDKSVTYKKKRKAKCVSFLKKLCLKKST